MPLKINKEFAKKFNERKDIQALQKLKHKYDEEDDDDKISTESEDELSDDNAFTEKFLETIKAISKKDPKIYDPNVKFFDDYVKVEKEPKERKKKEKSLTVRDYEGTHVLKLEAKQEEDEDEVPVKLEEDIVPNDNEERSLVNRFLKKIQKSKKEGPSVAIVKKEEDAKEAVAIKKEATEDSENKKAVTIKKEVAEDFENKEGDGSGDDKESVDGKYEFLISYFKDKKYLNDEEMAADDVEDASEDEKEFDKLEEFEQKFVLRHEDPDEDFIKSYPRTIASSLRMAVNKRAEKRKRVAERKKQEEAKKQEELRTLRKLKRKEEMKKLKRLNKIGGIEFKPEDIDLDADFDPEQYDKMMKKKYGKEYYNEYDEEDVTEINEPVLDGEENEDWDNWTGNQDNGANEMQQEEEEEEEGNDAAVGGRQERSRKKSKKERKSKKLKKSKFEEMIEKNRSKPLFDPTKETFDEYLEKYYNLDFEDDIDGEFCKFRYRKVYPADYGLTTEEILQADEPELNAWVSLKKVNEFKTDEEEALYERGIKQKLKKKKKILKSLYKTDDKKDEKTVQQDEESANNDETTTEKYEKTTEKDKKPVVKEAKNAQNSAEKPKGKKRKRSNGGGLSEDRLEGYNIDPKKFKYMYQPMLREEKKKTKK